MVKILWMYYCTTCIHIPRKGVTLFDYTWCTIYYVISSTSSAVRSIPVLRVLHCSLVGCCSILHLSRSACTSELYTTSTLHNTGRTSCVLCTSQDYVVCIECIHYTIQTTYTNCCVQHSTCIASPT